MKRDHFKSNLVVFVLGIILCNLLTDMVVQTSESSILFWIVWAGGFTIWYIVALKVLAFVGQGALVEKGKKILQECNNDHYEAILKLTEKS